MVGMIQGGLLGAQTYQFTINKNVKGEFYFIYHNVRGNVEPICWSEGYSTKQKCQEAIQKVKLGASSAGTHDLT